MLVEPTVLLSESTVDALLLGGVTGATIVFAAYSLMITRLQPLLGRRAKDFSTRLTAVKEKVVQIEVGTPPQQLINLEQELAALRALQRLPWYITWGIVLTFLGYCATSILAGLWLVPWNRDVFDPWIMRLFLTSTILLIVTGLMTITSVNKGLEEEYKATKSAAAGKGRSDTQ